VDDGYADFFHVAYPVFSAFGIPVTVFLVTDFIDSKGWLWVDRLAYAFRRASTSSLEIELPHGRPRRLPLASPADRDRAASIVREAAKKAANQERLRLLDAVPRLLGVAVPGGPPPEDAPLTWGQIRTMARGNVAFGAHTRSHPILSRVADVDELRDEIEGSKLRIEEELQAPVLHFCYPNGRPEDMGPRTIAVVQKAGFQTAVTMQGGLNFAGANPYLLKRIGVELKLPELLFREYAAGFRISGPALHPAAATM
jgi:peptidoglycan/xylan/chitin deacetylase (PgdA/CDA1 family)